MIELTITDSNILNGEHGACRRCPIALALIDNGFSRPYVSPRLIAFDDQSGARRFYATPYDAKVFMKRFDNQDIYESVEELLKELPRKINLTVKEHMLSSVPWEAF